MSNFINLDTSEEYYFTFGFGHEYPNCYTIIKATSWVKARENMYRIYGNKWAFQYMSAEAAGVEEYKLKCIAIHPVYE